MTKEIPHNWKQTKLGSIPVDWWDGTIQDLVDGGVIEKPMDGNHGSIHPKSSDYIDEGIPFIMANDIVDERLYHKQANKLKKDQADKLQKGFSLTGDVLFTHKGSVGNTAIVPQLDTEYIMLTPQVTYYRVKDKAKLHPIFLRKLFQSERFQSLISHLSGGGTRAYIGISAQRALPFYYPPLPEQHRIVAVLETWDQAIDALTRKIQIKKNIKKGLMQQLLTGKKRLPGFDREWETVKLGDVCEIVSGGTPSTTESSYWDGDIDWITPTEITKFKHRHIGSTKRKITQSGLDSSSTKLIPADSLILCSRATVGACGINRRPITTNQGFKNIVPRKELLDINFIYYLIISKRSYLLNISSGSTFLEFSKHDLFKMKISIPNIEEQAAIAQILTTADDEITALEKKKQLLEDQKKYLLNNLITGQIRTPENMKI